MGKPSAPDTISLHLPEPTGHDAHDAPYWVIGPYRISVEVMISGPGVGRHGVFVDSFDPIPEGETLAVAGAILAAGKAAKAADARAARAQELTRAEQVEEIARNETPRDLVKAFYSAANCGDAESVDLFGDALAWQAANPLTEVTT